MERKSYEQSIEELSLMLIYLTRQQDNNEYCRYRELSWKGYDFKALERDRKLIILTCLANKVKMYKKMGFDDKGMWNMIKRICSPLFMQAFVRESRSLDLRILIQESSKKSC